MLHVVSGRNDEALRTSAFPNLRSPDEASSHAMALFFQRSVRVVFPLQATGLLSASSGMIVIRSGTVLPSTHAIVILLRLQEQLA